MKLTIFEATGRTRQHLLHQTLNDGHQVTVLLRDPDKLTERSDRLTVVEGCLKDATCVDQVIAGADAVLSTLGPSNNQPSFEITAGCRRLSAR